MRRVRSSKCGQTERNFRFNSDNVFMSAKHNAMTPRLIPLFIYRALLLTDYAEESIASSRSWPHAESRPGKAGHHSNARCLVPHDGWPMAGDAALHSTGGGSGHSAAQTQARVAATTATSDQSSSPRISLKSSLPVVPTFSIRSLKINELNCSVCPYCERQVRSHLDGLPTNIRRLEPYRTGPRE